jgi:hypothetical protein
VQHPNSRISLEVITIQFSRLSSHPDFTGESGVTRLPVMRAEVVPHHAREHKDRVWKIAEFAELLKLDTPIVCDMIADMTLQWQKLSDKGSPYSSTFRAKVPGGWLVQVRAEGGSGITFYPDPEHEWDGGSLP